MNFSILRIKWSYVLANHSSSHRVRYAADQSPRPRYRDCGAGLGLQWISDARGRVRSGGGSRHAGWRLFPGARATGGGKCSGTRPKFTLPAGLRRYDGEQGTLVDDGHHVHGTTELQQGAIGSFCGWIRGRGKQRDDPPPGMLMWCTCTKTTR